MWEGGICDISVVDLPSSLASQLGRKFPLVGGDKSANETKRNGRKTAIISRPRKITAPLRGRSKVLL